MGDLIRNSLQTIATVLLIFSSFGNATYEECVASVRNIVVYEGTPNTVFVCSAGPNGTAWAVRPTSNSSRTYQITSFDDSVSSTLNGLYAFNQTGLIVRNATTNGSGNDQATAGTYIVSFNTTTRLAFKLVVIRSGPTCYCIQSAPDSVNISCTMVYADHPARGSEINAVMNCTANGQFYNAATLTKTLVPYTPPQYVYNSTSTIRVNNTGPTTYDCVVAFAAPPSPSPAYLARNAPDFSVNKQIFCGQTTTASPTTTTERTTTTKPSTTTTPATTTIKVTTTTLSTTSNQPTTATQQSTTASSTTTTQPTTTTIINPSTTKSLETTIQPLSTSAELKSTSAEYTTTAVATLVTTSPIDIGLLSAKIALGTVLGTLMAATAAVGCCLGFLCWCPLLIATRRPTQFIVDEIQRLPRREWIPVPREIRRMEYRVIPFYKQTFCRSPTPYEYRLGLRGRCVQSWVAQPRLTYVYEDMFSYRNRPT